MSNPMMGLLPPRNEEIRKALAGCLRGDVRAQERFYHYLRDDALRTATSVIRAYGNSRSASYDAEDFCADVFEKVFSHDCRRLRSLRSPDAVRPWFRQIVRNHASGLLRREAARRRCLTLLDAERPAFDGDCSEEVEHQERFALLRKEMARLAPEEREILKLFYFEGLSYRDICERMCINMNTLAARLRRARIRLCDRLQARLDALGQASADAPGPPYSG